MSWTILMVALCALGLVVAAAAVQMRRGGFSRNSSTVEPVSFSGGSARYFGLASQDAVQFERAAQEDRRREQGLWDRDYQQDATAGAMPGRVAGIPRSLRVRR